MMRAAPWMLVLILLGFNAVLLNQNYRLKRSVSSRTVPAASLLARLMLPSVELQDAERRTHGIASLLPKTGHLLVVLFTPSDCPACLEERTLWQTIPETCEVPVIGLASNASSREFWNWLRNLNLRIPVFLDTTGTLIDSLDPRQLPIKLLVNSTGAIAWADPPRFSATERNAFCNDLHSVIGE